MGGGAMSASSPVRLRTAKKVWVARKTPHHHHRLETVDHAIGRLLRAHRRGSALLPWPRMEHPVSGSRAMFYVLEQGRAVPARDVITGYLFMERRCNRQVRSTSLGVVWISTVFLAVDHSCTSNGPPVLWETMVFSHEDMPASEEIAYYQRRYGSRLEAVAGHEEVVAEVRAFLARRAQA